MSEVQLGGGYVAEDPKLDRLPSQNEARLDLYPAARVLEAAPEVPVRPRRWRRGPILDQGNEGACVGFSGTNFLRASPIRNRDIGPLRDVRDPFARALYHECQRNDEWPGEDYSGTSVDALGKVLKARGLIASYYWITGGAEELARVLMQQPAVMGTWWWSGMDAANTNGTGVALPTGRKRGGHAWLVDGYVPRMTLGEFTGPFFRGFNSWGRWGANKRGTFWVPASAMQTLLTDDGEAMVPSELAV